MTTNDPAGQQQTDENRIQALWDEFFKNSDNLTEVKFNIIEHDLISIGGTPAKDRIKQIREHSPAFRRSVVSLRKEKEDLSGKRNLSEKENKRLEQINDMLNDRVESWNIENTPVSFLETLINAKTPDGRYVVTPKQALEVMLTALQYVNNDERSIIFYRNHSKAIRHKVQMMATDPGYIQKEIDKRKEWDKEYYGEFIYGEFVGGIDRDYSHDGLIVNILVDGPENEFDTAVIARDVAGRFNASSDYQAGLRQLLISQNRETRSGQGNPRVSKNNFL